MKLLKNTLIVFALLFVVGCNKTYTIQTGKTYYDKNNMYNGASLTRIELKDDTTALSTTCGKEAGCSVYKGTYEIKDDIIKITLNAYQEMTGEWEKLADEYVETIEYKITNNNEFTFTPEGGEKQEFVMEK